MTSQKLRFKGFHSKTPSVASISFKKDLFHGFPQWSEAILIVTLICFFKPKGPLVKRWKLAKFGDQIGSRKKELHPILGWTSWGCISRTQFVVKDGIFGHQEMILLKVQKSGDHQLICYISASSTRFYTSQVVQDFFHQQHQNPHLPVPYLEPQRLPVANLIYQVTINPWWSKYI